MAQPADQTGPPGNAGVGPYVLIAATGDDYGVRRPKLKGVVWQQLSPDKQARAVLSVSAQFTSPDFWALISSHQLWFLLPVLLVVIPPSIVTWVLLSVSAAGLFVACWWSFHKRMSAAVSLLGWRGFPSSPVSVNGYMLGHAIIITEMSSILYLYRYPDIVLSRPYPALGRLLAAWLIAVALMLRSALGGREYIATAGQTVSTEAMICGAAPLICMAVLSIGQYYSVGQKKFWIVFGTSVFPYMWVFGGMTVFGCMRGHYV